MDSIEFGRKINYVPMTVSLVVGLLVGILIFVFTKITLLAVLLGVTALVIAALLYARSMDDFYGYWEINDEGIKSYDYLNFSIRLQSVMFPFSESQLALKFNDIKGLTVVVGKEMNAPSNILGGSFNAPKKIMFHLPTPYYLELKLNDGRQVNLDLSADWDDTETIEYVIALICSEADIPAEIIKQEN
ncbi:hypothetical protein ACFQAV_02615 [Companilactobacillus huachuanensis]|uniref:DUF58 domain-containing protein n=1 Tax=Companilactobacillus huachuanensis TaxID=2559914 RepID=A0ABW1RI05_9LACO|nr:hypothetical protein [Companilactobacillus huachuanensis]